MASFVKQLFCGFLLLVLFSSLIQARESKFFSKFTHFSTPLNNADNTIASSPIQAPGLSPVEAPATVEIIAPAPEPTASAPGGENELFDEEFEGGSYEKEYQSSNYNNNENSNGYTTNNNNNNGYATSNYNNNNVYTTSNYNNYNGYKLAGESESHETANQNNYNNNGYTGNYYNNNGYELASESYETGNQNNNNRYSTVNYNNNNNGYEADQRQGMSDTRFMEGGKYYYDVKNENYYYPANGHATGQASTQNQVNYGNSVNINRNEFNTMQYENQEPYDENQEEESLP